MQTIQLGPSAPEVAAIGFGGMPLSTRGRPDEAVGIGVIHSVMDAGVTLLDTADVYCLDERDMGHNERLFARALESWSGSRASIIVATKGGMVRPGGRWERDAHPDQLRAACENSLRALNVDRIDLYQLHTPDPKVPFADSVGAIAELQAQGKVRWAGLSNVSVAQIEQASSLLTVVTVQNRLNPFFREAVTEGVASHCAENGIGFLAYSPVGGGRLNKKLSTHSELASIATRLGVSAHAVVLAWVRAQGSTVIPIPATRSIDHALDSVKSANIELSASDLAAIDTASFSTS